MAESATVRKPRRKRVNKSDLLSDADLSSPESFAKSLTPELFAFAFAIPALFGMGSHWYLNSEEEKEISEASWLAIKALPKQQRKSFELWATKYLPFVMFALVTGVITGKRIMASFDLWKEAKRKTGVQRVTNNDLANRTETGTADQTSNPGNTVKQTLSDPISQSFGQYGRTGN